MVGWDVVDGVGAFTILCATGCPTVMVTPDNPGDDAKLEEIALVVVELDGDVVMVATGIEGGTMTSYLTDRPTTVGACRLISVDVKRREDVGQAAVVPSLYRHRIVMVPRTQFAGKLAVNAAAMLMVNAEIAAVVVIPRND